MPRVKPSPDADDVKPYSKTRVQKTNATAQPWTNAEYLVLLDHVLSGSKDFKAAVPNRNTNQSRKCWKQTVEPCIRSALSSTPTGSASSSWTSAEYLALLDHVLAKGPTAFEEAVANRTANQSRKSWKQTVEPRIRAAVADKTTKGGPKKMDVVDQYMNWGAD